MAESLELIPTLPDVGRQPEIAISAYKPDVVITQERYEISARFQRILDTFDHAQHADKGGATGLTVGGPKFRGAEGAEYRDAECVEGGGVWGGGLPPAQAPTNFGTLRRKSVH